MLQHDVHVMLGNCSKEADHKTTMALVVVLVVLAPILPEHFDRTQIYRVCNSRS